jgi:tetratricopeptide (TPR) repeat protein
MLRNAVLAFAVAAGALLCARPAMAADAALASKWVAYGQQLYAQQQYDKAVTAFSTAAKANSADVAAWTGLGNALYAKRDYAHALTYYKYALQLNPGDTRLAAFVQQVAAATAGGSQAGGSDAYSLGNRYYSARQYPYAIQEYNAALAKNPNDARSYQGLGNCYYAQGNKAQAVEAYKRALQINPANTGLKAFLARYSPQDAQAAGVEVASGPKDWVDPLWRSAVLPGWGQGYNGESTKGWILGTLTVGATTPGMRWPRSTTSAPSASWPFTPSTWWTPSWTPSPRPTPSAWPPARPRPCSSACWTTAWSEPSSTS